MSKVHELGVDPLHILLLFAKGDYVALGEKQPIPIAIRAQTAAAACHYIHPVLKAVEVSGPNGESLIPQNQPDLKDLTADELMIFRKAYGKAYGDCDETD